MLIPLLLRRVPNHSGACRSGGAPIYLARTDRDEFGKRLAGDDGLRHATAEGLLRDRAAAGARPIQVAAVDRKCGGWPRVRRECTARAAIDGNADDRVVDDEIDARAIRRDWRAQ